MKPGWFVRYNNPKSAHWVEGGSDVGDRWGFDSRCGKLFGRDTDKLAPANKGDRRCKTCLSRKIKESITRMEEMVN